MTSSRSGLALCAPAAALAPARAQAKRPNIVMLMTDDTGWNDFGAYSGGGAALGHPTPNVDRIAKEGAALHQLVRPGELHGRPRLLHDRAHPDPLGALHRGGSGRRELSQQGDADHRGVLPEERLRTYFSGKWHLGDKPEFYPMEHGFDEMKNFAAYYAGVYAYSDTSSEIHPWFPSYNADFIKAYNAVVNTRRVGGRRRPAGQAGRRQSTTTISPTFDVRQTDSAVDYIKAHAKDDKPFFMDVNFMKMHNPNNPAPAFRGKSHLGNYSDSMLELDSNIGRIMDAIRAAGARHHRHRDGRQRCLAGRLSRCRHHAVPRREGLGLRGRLAGSRHHVVARACPGRRQVRRDDVAYRRLGDARRHGRPTPPPHDWVGNDGKPIYFDSIDNSAYVLGKAQHSART